MITALSKKCGFILKIKNNFIFNNMCSSSYEQRVEPANFSLFNLKKQLKSTNINFEDGYTCLKLDCPVCDPGAIERKKIFINKITGQFICPSCQISDTFTNVEKKFINNKSQTEKMLENYRQLFMESKPKIEDLQVKSKGLKFEQLTEDKKREILNYFQIMDIPLAGFNNVEVYYNDASKELIFPMYNFVNQIVGYKILQRINNEKNMEKTFPECKSQGVISVSSKVPTSKTKETIAILVTNILDLLSLNNKKINGTIICLPHGCTSLPLECLPILERFQKLILWFNYDVTNWETAKNFAKKLEEKRCAFVRPTEIHSSPYYALQQNLDLKSIITKSQPILHKSITTFTSLRQDVLSELQNIDKVQGVKWKRFPLLNKYLKGHRKGELTILTGPTGCGKTTFMSEFSLDLILQGVNTLWGSFEIINTRLASTLLRQMAGHPLDINLNEFNYWADKFEQLPVYFMTFHGQQTIKVVMEAIEHAQYVHDINHVIIDNLQFMMGVMDEAKHMDRFWRQDDIIAAFRTFATKKNCHVTLVIHPRKERDAEDLTTSSIFGSAKAAQEADNVLIIQDKRLTTIRGKKYLQIAKNRYSGDLGIMPMEFDKAGLSYATKKSKVEQVKVLTNQNSINQT